MLRMRVLLITIAAMAAATAASAQVKCTMPNGVTITRQLGNCPHDAVAAFSLDGQPLAKPSETPEGQRALEQIKQHKDAQENAEQERIKAAHEAKLKEWQQESAEKKKLEQKRLTDNHIALHGNSCHTLSLPRHRCEVQTSSFQGNYVILKTHILEHDIDSSCKQAAGKLRDQLLNGRGAKDWQVRIVYTPTGATISECAI